MDKKKSESRPVHATVMVIDDEAGIRESMAILFRREGYRVEAVESGERAVEILDAAPFDLVITDLRLTGMSGVEVLKQVKQASPETEVVVMTAYGTIEGAVEAIKAGAYDYLTKPFQPEELTLVAGRALERKRLAQKVKVLEETVRSREPFMGVVGTSKAMRDVLRVVDKVARIDTTVLISGESGTGKELIARALHARSQRKDRPLIIVNCGTIPDNLQESELFGHVQGSFTGAHKDKRGLFEEAHCGTAFLDEVGELTPAAQVKMLRFLQDGEVRKVGSTSARNLDVRILAATNRNLEKSAEEGSFREDLYYRLNVIPVNLPALRERPEDIPPLVQHFVKLASTQLNVTHPPTVPPRALRLLAAQPWRGNIRELENVIRRAIALDRDGILGIDDLPFGDSEKSEDKILLRARQGSFTLSNLERDYILEVLAEYGGSRVKTAERLGITTATLWRKLKQYEKEGHRL